MADLAVAAGDLSVRRSLRSYTLVGLLFLAVAFVVGVVLIMLLQARPKIFAESSLRIEQVGNGVVETLNSRSQEITALTRTLANTFNVLPKEESLFLNALPTLIDFNEDFRVAGGGIWPEPFLFEKEKERRSFFWGRENSGQLSYFDDYNDPQGDGYHRQEWYVPAQFQAPNRCYWSQSYVDPYSKAPMVTCTVGLFLDNSFAGAATIDLKLQGIQNFINEKQKTTGGYIFLADQNNQLIALPQPLLEKGLAFQKDDQTAWSLADLVEQTPDFAVLAKILTDENALLVQKAQEIDPDRFAQILANLQSAVSNITLPQAEMIAVALLNPLQQETSFLLQKQRIQDPLLQKAATLYLFHVPNTYWKLAIVKPIEEETIIAQNITLTLIFYFVILIAVIILSVYFVLTYLVVNPLAKISKNMEIATRFLQKNQFKDLLTLYIPVSEKKIKSANEITVLQGGFSHLLENIIISQNELQNLNTFLENKVEERTNDLQRSLQQLKASQLALVQSEKMASLGQMVAGLAHEMNTPLGYLRSNVETMASLAKQIQKAIDLTEVLLMHMQAEDADEAAMAETFAQLEKQLERLKRMQVFAVLLQNADDSLFGLDQLSELIVNMRNFSRMDQAKTDSVDIHDCIESTLKIGRNVFKSVNIEKQFSSLPAITCAPSQINQVLLNILKNAAEAIDPEKGKIIVKTEALEKYLRITIADNGHGIPQDKLNKIFDPFFTTKSVGKGTGLGLSISYQIIKDHGGIIKVQSVVGKGTIFQILLPIEYKKSLETKE